MVTGLTRDISITAKFLIGKEFSSKLDSLRTSGKIILDPNRLPGQLCINR
jgi:hypothetical protein